MRATLLSLALVALGSGAQTLDSATPPNIGLRELPLTEVGPRHPARDLVAIMLSGDGGWVGLDREVAAALAAHGIPVVGWDSLRYFWIARTPDEAARDLDRVIRHYLDKWRKSHAAIIGYSMGADALPFMVSRLPEESAHRVALVALLGPGREAFFEFHISFWLNRPSGGLPIGPEMRRLERHELLCIYGAEEKASLCRSLSPRVAHIVELPGGHHFNGDYRTLARWILKSLR